MKDKFNQQVSINGVPPEQTREALMSSNPLGEQQESPQENQQAQQQQTERTMIEREQLTPVLKPYLALSQTVDNQTHRQQLIAERTRLLAFREQTVAIHTKLHIEGKLVASYIEKPMQTIQSAHKLRDDFNTYVAQVHDMKELGWSY